MGKKSKRDRQRRAEQHRQAARLREHAMGDGPDGSAERASLRQPPFAGHSGRGAARGRTEPSDQRVVIHDLLTTAVNAHLATKPNVFDLAVDRLVVLATPPPVHRPPQPLGGLSEGAAPRADAQHTQPPPPPDSAAARSSALVSQIVAAELSRGLRSCWRYGWQPLDVVSVVRRLETPAHADIAAAAVVDDAQHDAGQPMHPLWSAQLEDLEPWWSRREQATPWLGRIVATNGMSWRDAVERVVVLVARVQMLPKLPILIPPPGPGAAAAAARRVDARTGAIDPKMLGRVRALLAKAESTEFPDEADALTEKAQELMTRYSIDVAMLAAVAGAAGAGNDGAEARRIHLDPPYVDAKATLVGAVATANRCKAVLDSSLGFVTVFGFATDLAVVDLLFTSLLAQATTAMVAAGRVVSRTGQTKTRSFRQTFLVAFAVRIGERLREAAATSTREAETAFGASMLPVLAHRDEVVEEAAATAFPHTRTIRTRVSNEAGWHAGRLAADQASLGAGAELRS